MKYLFALSLLCFSQMAHAESDTDKWFCTTQVSERRGYAVLACGNGNSIPNSFAAAQDEFDRICDASADCAGHNVIVVPKRMQQLPNGTYVRLVEFDIQDSMSGIPIKTVAERKAALKERNRIEKEKAYSAYVAAYAAADEPATARAQKWYDSIDSD